MERHSRLPLPRLHPRAPSPPFPTSRSPAPPFFSASPVLSALCLSTLSLSLSCVITYEGGLPLAKSIPAGSILAKSTGAPPSRIYTRVLPQIHSWPPSPVPSIAMAIVLYFLAGLPHTLDLRTRCSFPASQVTLNAPPLLDRSRSRRRCLDSISDCYPSTSSLSSVTDGCNLQ